MKQSNSHVEAPHAVVCRGCVWQVGAMHGMGQRWLLKLTSAIRGVGKALQVVSGSGLAVQGAIMQKTKEQNATYKTMAN